MKSVLKVMNAVALLVGYVAIVVYLIPVGHFVCRIPQYYRPDPGESVCMATDKIVAEYCSQRSPNGDGCSMIVWHLSGPSNDIARVVDGSQIEKGRVWMHSPFDDRARQAFAWVTEQGEYEKVEDKVQQIVSDDFFYTYDALQGGTNFMMNCKMWIVSPRHKLLAFLSQDT